MADATVVGDGRRISFVGDHSRLVGAQCNGANEVIWDSKGE